MTNIEECFVVIDKKTSKRVYNSIFDRQEGEFIVKQNLNDFELVSLDVYFIELEMPWY